MDGFINVLKPTGMSSHDVVDVVRRIFHQKRVGHAGTLDPAAAGILPIALGRAARLVEYLEGADKSYRAEIAFGYATDTGDVYGTVTERAEHPVLPAEEEIEAVLARFRGCITQRPPAYSAIKVGGKRAADLVRQGRAVDIPTRKVTIHRLELLHIDAVRQRIRIDVDCSKGTYIRSLCADIGAALHLPATMRFLLRSRVGAFTLADAYTPEELAEAGRMPSARQTAPSRSRAMSWHSSASRPFTAGSQPRNGALSLQGFIVSMRTAFFSVSDAMMPMHRRCTRRRRFRRFEI